MSLMTTQKLSTSTLLLLLPLFMLLLLLSLSPVATLLTTTLPTSTANSNNNNNPVLLGQPTTATTAYGEHDNKSTFVSENATSNNTKTKTNFRSKRLSYFELQQTEQKFSLPNVPLPPPPPFPGVGLNAFAGTASIPGIGGKVPNAFAVGSSSFSSSSSGSGTSLPDGSSQRCGGVLKARYGIIQTPNFPHKFDTPIECVWVIDASELPSVPSIGHGGSSSYSSPSSVTNNVSIVVYMTQLYVLDGLRFTEYMYYSDDFKVPAHRVFTLREDDVTQVAWIQFNSQYLEIRFTMQTLDGTHLRALDRLLDVYGFNITYEVQNEVKPYQCNTLQCRFLGNCYANKDFSSYGCSCFSGFSGIDCGHGPLCEDTNTNVCQNGGTCKHIGDAAITCHCPAGFKGNKCEIPEINETTLGCTLNSSTTNCHRECEFEHPNAGYSMLKNSRSAARTGKTRYEVTIRLGTNLTAFYRHAETERRTNDQLPSLLEKHLARVLRNFNVTRINDLEVISNTTDRLDITFHFFGIKGDSSRIREAITRMVERGRIGNITLVSNYHHFDENPPLNLSELSVNQQPAVREGSKFIISCTAQGSSRMQFQWYKDGVIVNASRATREIWTTVLPPETKDFFTAILGITNANSIDEGVYSCKVTDWGVEQCRSLHIHIRSPPRLRVDPASVTLERGDSLRVRCLSPDNDDIKRYAQLGYSWTRNGVLFQSASSTAMWEDLYPDGSILKINNIQKSAEYTCLVSNTVKSVSKSVYINVIERKALHICDVETTFGVNWPRSAPGVPIIADCPRGYEGHSQRICEQSAASNSTWLLPDFSMCIRDELLTIYNRFRALRSGYQLTNSSNILKACFDYTIQRHKSFLPGEASFLIDMLNELDTYLQLKGTQLEREMAAEIILHIIDKVMQNAQSLNSQQQIKKLQLLTQSAALNRETIAASQLATSTSGSAGSNKIPQASITASSSSSSATSTSSSTSSSVNSVSSISTGSSSKSSNSAGTSSLLPASSGGGGGNKMQRFGNSAAAADANSILTVDEDTLSLDRLNSLRIYMTSVKTLPFNLRIYGDDLFSDQLYMEIGLSSRLMHLMTNATIFASVISYKNLKSFLPKTYYTRGSDPKDADYVLASRIIQTWLFQSNRSNDNFREPLDLPFEAGHVEIIFQHENVAKEGDWIAVCGHDYKASFESTWRSDLCITKHLMENITRCICPLSGTYVVMLTKRSHNPTQPSPLQRPLFVIVSCACCLLQSCSAFMILLSIWCNRKCAITFLKMQFCVSTSSVMLIFLLGFLKMLPANWHAIISSSLASLLLFGISTLIAIALVIHTELVPKKYLQIANKGSRSTTGLGGGTSGKQDIVVSDSEKRRRPSSTTGGSLDDGLAGLSLTNITQISASSSVTMASSATSTLKRREATSSTMGGGVGRPPALLSQRQLLVEMPAAGIRGAIGISWLLPLLYAIAAPLICSIIGKCPRNWWLEIMTMPERNDETSSSSTQEDPHENLYYATHSLFNGDNLLLEATTITTPLNTITLSSDNNTTVASTPSLSSSTAWPSSSATSSSTTSTTTRSTLSPSSSITSTLPYSVTSYSTSPLYYGIAETEMTHRRAAAYTSPLVSPSTQAVAVSPSTSFILFVCVDLLFILLFFALFAILMKKLLWLWHKNRNVHTHPLDKFNMAMRRRFGLLYRTSSLFLIKLCTDGFFIAYVNSTAQDSLWSYPFGISAILLGFAILFCFILKAECQLRGPAYGSHSAATTLKTKFNTSKTSLDENYSINSPLSFYTTEEKERDNEAGAPAATVAATLHHQQQKQVSTAGSGGTTSGASGQQLPLTIISTAPRCQMLPTSGPTPNNCESFLNAAATLEHCKPSSAQFAACMQDKILLGSAANITSPATRCCALLGGSEGGGGIGSTQTLPAGTTMLSGATCYDAYAGGALTLTGSLGRRALHQQHQHQQQQQQSILPEFMGLQTLDILQGVAADSSVIGIRSNNMLSPASYHHQQQQQQQMPATILLQHSPYVDATLLTMPTPTIVSISGLTTNNLTSYSNSNNQTSITTSSLSPGSGSGPAKTATSSLSTQTPKAQKRVTIMEPTTHTFDPMLPTMVAVSASTTTTAGSPGAFSGGSDGATATATESKSPGIKHVDGMLVRITHDLDYLLNRRDDIKNEDDIPPPPLPPASATPSPNVGGGVGGTDLRQHDVIIEENEPDS